MQTLVRLFFKILRRILGPFMLLWEWLTRPTPLVRPADAQAEIDRQCKNLALYQFKTCPFCIKVRQELRRLALPVELRDAQAEGPHRRDLLSGGGRAMVPCLRISDATGNSEWLYESSAIIDYLQRRFAEQPEPAAQLSTHG